MRAMESNQNHWTGIWNLTFGKRTPRPVSGGMCVETVTTWSTEKEQGFCLEKDFELYTETFILYWFSMCNSNFKHKLWAKL